MIGRVWWTWQNLDLETRESAIEGRAGTTGDDNAKNATLDDELVMRLYVRYPNVTIGDAMSTVGGPFCYILAYISDYLGVEKGEILSIS